MIHVAETRPPLRVKLRDLLHVTNHLIISNPHNFYLLEGCLTVHLPHEII